MPESRSRAGDVARPRAIILKLVRLTVVRGKDRGREVVVAADVVRVGKAPENDLVLADDTVSRLHCEIVRDSKGWLLRDLRSTNGTLLDGAEIKEAYLRPGALISTGAAQIRFQPFDERVEPAPLDSLGDLIGSAASMREVLGVAARVAATDVSVLVEGEPGTGREALARTLHAQSRRRDEPFVVVDCRRPSVSLDAELFGPERPTAASRQVGFERARGGTLLLEEVAEMSADLQAKLLRAIGEREVRRGPAGRPVRVDARLMSSTQRPLLREVERGRFSSELAQALAAVTLALPPLRDRGGDIAILAQHFRVRDGGRPLTPAELAWLGAHDWPGNLDELRAVVARGMPAGDGATTSFDPDVPFRELKERWNDEFERRYLTWLLARAGGNVSKASRDADMDRKYLHKLLAKHGIGG